MAQQNEDHQDLLFKYRMATAKPELETCQDVQIKTYVTCHIKCIDGEHGELLQVSAVSRHQTFNKYVKHQGQISAKVAQQTGLEMRLGKLWRYDKVVKSFRSVKSTIKLLLEWLGTLEQPLLLIGSCDWYPLLREIETHKLVHPFENIVLGLCDARDLFKDRKNTKKLSIQELSTRLLEGCNKAKKSEKAVDDCDGLIWVKLLQSMLDKKVSTGGIKETLCHINKISFDFKSSMLHAEYITAGERNFEFEWHNRSLKNASISNQIAKQIAYSGLNFKDIWLMYKKWGMAGIRRCFSSKVKKKFRVTSNEKSICSVIGYLASQINLDEHEEHETLHPSSSLPKTTQTLLTEAQLQNPVARLDVAGKIHKIYPGENKIGRNPSTCTVLMQSQRVCLEHAILKVTGDSHFITHLGGPNEVWVGKVKLKEKMPYPLRGGECLKFGDVCAKYIICTRGEHDVTCSAVQSFLTNELLCLCPFLHNIENPAEFSSTQMGSSENEGWQTNLKYILERINIFISAHPKNHLPYVAVACNQNGSIVVPHEALGGGLHWSADLSSSFSSMDVNRSAMDGFLTWLQQGFSSGVPVLVVAHNEHLTQLQASLATTAHVIHHATATRFIQYLISKSTGRNIEIARNKERNAIGWVVYMQNLLSNMYMELRRALDDCQRGKLRDLLELLAKVMDKLGFGGVLYLLTILYDQPQTKTIKKRWDDPSHSTLCDIKSEITVDSAISVICIDDDSDEDMNSLPDISPKKEPFKSKFKYDDDDDNEDNDISIIEECKKEDSSICIDLDSDSGDDTENISTNKQIFNVLLNSEKPKTTESENNVSIKDNCLVKQNLRCWKKDSEQSSYKSTSSKSQKETFMVNVENRVNELLGRQKSASKRKSVSEEELFGASLSDKRFLTEEELFGNSSEENMLTEEQLFRTNVGESISDSDEPYGKHLKKISKTHVTEEELFGSEIKKGKVMVTVEDLFGSDARKEKVMVSKEELFRQTTGQKTFGLMGPNLSKQMNSTVDQKEISSNENNANVNKQNVRKEQQGSSSYAILKNVTTYDHSKQSLVDENIQIITEKELFGFNSNKLENGNKKNHNNKNLNQHLNAENTTVGIYFDELKILDEDATVKNPANYRDIVELEGKQSKSCLGKNNDTSCGKGLFRSKKEENVKMLRKERQHTNNSCFSYEKLTVEDLFETSVEDTNIQLVTEKDLFEINLKELDKEPKNKKLRKDLGTEKSKKHGKDIQLITQEELFGTSLNEFDNEPRKRIQKYKNKKINKEHGTEKAKNVVTNIQIVTEELLFGSDLNELEIESKNNKLNKELGTEKTKKIKFCEKSKLCDKVEIYGRKSHKNATDKNEASNKIRKELGRKEKKHETSSKEEKWKADIVISNKNRGCQPLSDYTCDDHHMKTVENKVKTSSKTKIKSKSWNVTNVSEKKETNNCTKVSEKNETNKCTKVLKKTETNKCTKVLEKTETNECAKVSEKNETNRCTKVSEKTDSNKCTEVSEKTETNKCIKVSDKKETYKCQEVIEKTEEIKQQDIGKALSKSAPKVRPFNLLMRDVVFKVKGFQRQPFMELKEKMESMGAQYSSKKYQADVTHVIWASKPTKHPKGWTKKTVTADWVLEAFCNKKRYPWRQFSFESCEVSIRDNTIENSEDEIWAEELTKDSRLNNHIERKCRKSEKKELLLMSKASTPIKENVPEKVQILSDNTSSNIYDCDMTEILLCEQKLMQSETLQTEQKLMQQINPDQNHPLDDTEIQESRGFNVMSQESSGGFGCEGNVQDDADILPVCNSATTTKRLFGCTREFFSFCRRHRGMVKKKNPNIKNHEVNMMVGEWLSNLHLPSFRNKYAKFSKHLPAFRNLNKIKYKYSENIYAWRYVTELLRVKPDCRWKQLSASSVKKFFLISSSPSISCLSTADTLTIDNAATTSLSLASSNFMDSTTSRSMNKSTIATTSILSTDASLDSLQATDTASHASPAITITKSPKKTYLNENQNHISSRFPTHVISSNEQETKLPDNDKNIACTAHLHLSEVVKDPKNVSEEFEKKGSVHKKLVDPLSHIERHTLPLKIIKFEDAPSFPARTKYGLFVQEFKKDAGDNFTQATAREFWKRMNEEEKTVYAHRVKVLKKQSKELFLSYVRSLDSQQSKIFVGVKRAKLLPYFQEDIFAEEYPGADYPILISSPKKVKTAQTIKDAQSSIEASKHDMQIQKSPQIKVKSFDQLTEKGIVPLDSDFSRYEGFGVGSLSSSDISVNWTCPTTISEYNNTPYEEDAVYSDSEECQMDITEIDLTNETSCNETSWNEIRHEDIYEDHNRNPSNHIQDCNSWQGSSTATVMTSPNVRGKSTKTKENPKSLKKSIKELKKYVNRTKCQENWQPAFQKQIMGIEHLELMKQLELMTPRDNSCENIEQESLIYLMTHEVSSEKSGNESDLEIITPYVDSSEKLEKELEINLMTSHDDLTEKSEKEPEIDLMTPENLRKEAERSEVYEGFTVVKKTSIPNVNDFSFPDTNNKTEFDFEGFTE